MATPTQKKFNNTIKDINSKMGKSKQDKVYSYIEDKFISSYYDSGTPNAHKKIRKLNGFKYTFVIVAIILGSIIYLAAPNSKITALPFTTMICSIILFLFGLIHPSLAFLDGKSRFRVVWVYGLLFVISFVVGGLTLGARFGG